MARLFPATARLTAATSPVSGAVPLTLAIRFRTTNVDQGAGLFYFSNAGGTSLVGIFMNTGGAEAGIMYGDYGAAASRSNVAATANVWQTAVAVYASSTSRVFYLNGVAGTVETTSSTVTGLALTRIGNLYDGTETQTFTGDLAEAAVWTVALDAADVAAYHQGVSPLLIRPASLAGYWPLLGATSPEVDLRGRTELTLVNTPTASAHPLVYRPTVTLYGRPGAASILGTATFTTPAVALVGAGTTSTAGTGAVACSVPALAASGTLGAVPSTTGTGTISVSAPTLAGTGVASSFVAEEVSVYGVVPTEGRMRAVRPAGRVVTVAAEGRVLVVPS